MGSKVAELYSVASYPMNYFVDRNGNIVDYHMEFESGDEKQIATLVQKLLELAK